MASHRKTRPAKPPHESAGSHSETQPTVYDQMSEGEALFWNSLEYRVCRELQGMPDPRLRWYWCDGFLPEQYLLEDPKPKITGQVWICNGPAQEQWRFAFYLPAGTRRHEQIDWSSLLPAESASRWLGMDEASKHLEIEPAAATAES